MKEKLVTTLVARYPCLLREAIEVLIEGKWIQLLNNINEDKLCAETKKRKNGIDGENLACLDGPADRTQLKDDEMVEKEMQFIMERRLNFESNETQRTMKVQTIVTL